MNYPNTPPGAEAKLEAYQNALDEAMEKLRKARDAEVEAILVSGTEGLALIAAFAWLVHKQRILLAASPKPQAPKQAGEAQAQPVSISERRPA